MIAALTPRWGRFLFTWSGRETVMEAWEKQLAPPPPVQKTFATIRVSETAHRLIGNVEQTAGAVATAPKDELSAAYSLLNADRAPLYRYIAGLERRLSITRTITKRF